MERPFVVALDVGQQIEPRSDMRFFHCMTPNDSIERRFFVAVVFASASVSAEAYGVQDLLSCPAETTYRKVELKQHGVAIESCRYASQVRHGPYRSTRLSDGSLEWEVTFSNGKEEGIGRQYNSQGELLYTMPFVNGVDGPRTFTPAGFSALAEEVSALLTKDGKAVAVSASGEGGLTYEQVVPNQHPGRQASARQVKAFRAQMMGNMCPLLHKHPGIRLINVKVLWSGGEVALVEKIRARQCVGIVALRPSLVPNVRRHMAHQVDPRIQSEAGPLLEALQRLNYLPVASSFSASSFGNWLADFRGPTGTLRIVKDRGMYTVEGEKETLEPVSLWQAFTSMAEFQSRLLVWLRARKP